VYNRDSNVWVGVIMEGFRRLEYRVKLYTTFLFIAGIFVILIQFLDIQGRYRVMWTMASIVMVFYLAYRSYICAAYFLSNMTVDELTGAYNFRYFIARLKEEMERSVRYNRPLVLAFIDCDNFKYYNDKYGHLEGNIALKKIGRLLKNNTRVSDVVARFGGDEFAVILPETDMKNARFVMERTRKLIEETVYKTEPGEVTVSISLVNYGGEDVKVFLERADAYLYKAKMDKKNRVVEQRAL
jgi:diguanylate cyclase (GGDEF)-like protein